jgi:hypothetical protein
VAEISPLAEKTVYIFIASADFIKPVKLSLHKCSYQFSLTFIADTH